MVQEEVKFVWEEEIRVFMKEARKMQYYNSLKAKYEYIKEQMDKLSRIIDLAEKAEDYGVLTVGEWTGNAVYFDHGSLSFNYREVSEKTGVSVEELKNMSWREVLKKVSYWLTKQEVEMEDYIKEAEKYLTVEVKP